MKRRVLWACAMGLAVAGFTTTMPAQSSAKRYIVISRSQSSVSAALLNQIRNAGGNVLRDLSPMGLLAVSSTNPNFRKSVPDALAVVTDRRVDTPRPNIRLGPEVGGLQGAPTPPNTHDDDRFLDLQWGITAVDATDAWKLGRQGQGALVAVLDEGVDATHPDLAPNVRGDLSTSFAEDSNGQLEDWQPEPGFYFNHGTHVAGIIASANNAFGTVGVAPRAQIMAVAVLSRDLGYGLDSWILDGIRYAADHGADIINMSLGSGPLDTRGACDADGCYTAQEIQDLRTAYSYAAFYANVRGATVIASSGNDEFDFGANPQYIHLPSDAKGIISVSATAPVGWAVNDRTSLDQRASYSNFGRNRIDFSAPGGDFVYPGNENCTVAGITNPCWVFDMVFSPIPGGWSWAAGTSMAAPHAAGVAAQYVGAAGGRLPPVVVEATLKALADHPNGNPRRDDFYGYGRADSTAIDFPR